MKNNILNNFYSDCLLLRQYFSKYMLGAELSPFPRSESNLTKTIEIGLTGLWLRFRVLECFVLVLVPSIRVLYSGNTSVRFVDFTNSSFISQFRAHSSTSKVIFVTISRPKSRVAVGNDQLLNQKCLGKRDFFIMDLK